VDIDTLKKYFSYFLMACGLLVVVMMVYTTLLISRYAQEEQRIKESYAEEENMTPTPVPTIIQRIRIP